MTFTVPEENGVDRDFALRSAKYLAQHGMEADEICDALCAELDLTSDDASRLVGLMAA